MMTSQTEAGVVAGLADKVDIFYGNENGTIPGVGLPHAEMVVTPNSKEKPYWGTYYPGADFIGFTQRQRILLFSMVGDVETDPLLRQSATSAELGRCFDYRLNLTRFGVRCEATASEHAAIYRYTFPRGNKSLLGIDIPYSRGDANTAKGNIEVSVDPSAGQITGSCVFVSTWGPSEKFPLYFCARFSKAPSGYGTWNGTAVHEGNPRETGVSARVGGYFRLDTDGEETVLVKIACSYHSVARAVSYLNEEIPDWNYDRVRDDARAAWDRELSRLQVTGGTEEQQKIFYSCLWLSYRFPWNATGEFHEFGDRTMWSGMVLWDRWKSLFPLMGVLRPDMVSGVINSFVERFRTRGVVTSVIIDGKEFAAGQGGNEADAVVYDAFLRNVPNVSWSDAYALVKHNADNRRTPKYRSLGYVPVGDQEGYSWRLTPVSGTLTFAHNDYCAARLAEALGNRADREKYLARSGNWYNTWNPDAAASGHQGFPIPRRTDGSFETRGPTNYYSKGSVYESSPYEMSFFVPHDKEGMIDATGGRSKFVDRLDLGFSKGWIMDGNEPSFLTYMLFACAGRPDRGSYWVDHTLRRFTDDKMPGDNDDGGMSSHYIWLSAGLYPDAAVSDRYYLYGPHFDALTFELPESKVFSIVAVNRSDKNIYVQSVSLDGRELDVPWITHSDIAAGSKLVFTMGPEPSSWGTVDTGNSLVHSPALMERSPATGNSQGRKYTLDGRVTASRLSATGPAGKGRTATNVLVDRTGATLSPKGHLQRN